ncbi:MAG: DNA polymerase III subunit delta [Pirellulaceae bacterium]
MPTVHAFDFLEQPPASTSAGVVVLFGDELFLRRRALIRLRAVLLGEDHQDVPFATFSGGEAEWRDVRDELSTVSLFGGGGRRLAVVEDADSFVTQHREQLGQYAERPCGGSTLLLIASAWPANTRLYKQVDKSGLQIDCRPPQVKKGKRSEIDEPRIAKWLVEWGLAEHAIQMTSRAASQLLELVGPELGLLDQELAKLALHVDSGGKVTPELVHEVSGGWRIKTTWDLVDAAADGDAAEALRQLERLLQSGQAPQGLLPPIAWSLRRYAVATRIFQQAERQRKRITLVAALQQAGFNDWPRGTLAKAEQRLKQMGRDRAGRLFRWLLEADLQLKGTHSNAERGRLALETLMLRLARSTATTNAVARTASK